MRIHEDVGAALALPTRLPPGITKLQQDRMKVARVEKCELLSKNDCSCPPHVWLGAAVATGLKLHIRAKTEGKYAGSVQACAVAHARNAQDVSTHAAVYVWCALRAVY